MENLNKTSISKLPTGILVKDKNGADIFFIDKDSNGNPIKRHITNMETINALPQDKKYWTEIDISHLDLPSGKKINKLQETAVRPKIESIEARGYDTTKNTDTTNTATGENIGNISTEQQNAFKDLYNQIENSGYSNAEKEILKNIVEQDYNGTTDYSMDKIKQIVADAETNARTDINPYYEKIDKRTIEDLRNQMADIRNESLRYKQQEATSYNKKLADTKQSLRARGLTFSGVSRSILGKESALRDTGLEGSMAQQRRMDWEDKSAVWQERARDLGTEAERELGSGRTPHYLGLANPYEVGVNGKRVEYNPTSTRALYLPAQTNDDEYVKTGESGLRKIRDVEKSKWNRLSNY